MNTTTKTAAQLVAEAKQRVENLTAEQVTAEIGKGQALLVDLREPGELAQSGTIPGAIHAPRGMLEFWVDPASPYYKDVFGSGKQFVLYCASAWRSALATAAVQDMGLEPVAHVEGGFTAWKKAGGPVGERPRKHEG